MDADRMTSFYNATGLQLIEDMQTVKTGRYKLSRVIRVFQTGRRIASMTELYEHVRAVCITDCEKTYRLKRVLQSVERREDSRIQTEYVLLLFS